MSNVSIRGTDYALQPLTLGAIRSLTREGHFTRIAEMMRVAAEKREPSAEELDAYLGSVVTLISTALLGSGHKSCDAAWVEGNVDRSTAAVVIAAVMAESGFKQETQSPNPQSP